MLVGVAALAVCGAPASATNHADHSDLAAGAALVCPGKLRTYYIAADEVAWDYAPSGKNLITGEPFDDVANVFVAAGPDRIGHVYMKSLYREYTDATVHHAEAATGQVATPR